MRIISGIYKSRKLIAPEGNQVRPTGDRAKETLFNILENRFSFVGTICLDAFCGTGNLGLECISRGAQKCYFVDADIRPVKKNIELLKTGNKCEVIKSETLDYLNKKTADKYDFIFCDPPYNYGKFDELIKADFEHKPVFILEHSGKINIDDNYEPQLIMHKKIGTINFSIYDFRK